MDELPSPAGSEPTEPARETRMLLVVTTPGIEVESVLPTRREHPPGAIHVAQPWKPVVCRCGEQHTAEDGEFLTLLVGPPQAEPGTNKNTFTLAIVPTLETDPYAASPYVAPEPDSGPFQEWASNVVAQFTDFFVGGCLCCRWDNIRILWDPSSDICGCGQVRDPSQGDVPVCSPDHARLRFAAEPALDSLAKAMGRLLERTAWITPQSLRFMVALGLDAEHGTIMDCQDAVQLLEDRLGEHAKVLFHEPFAPRGTVPILSVLGG